MNSASKNAFPVEPKLGSELGSVETEDAASEGGSEWRPEPFVSQFTQLHESMRALIEARLAQGEMGMPEDQREAIMQQLATSTGFILDSLSGSHTMWRGAGAPGRIPPRPSLKHGK